MGFCTFHSRSLQGRRPPSIVSVTVWKMCSTHPHIPWRSHYPRGLRGSTPKVCPFPHACFQWGTSSDPWWCSALLSLGLEAGILLLYFWVGWGKGGFVGSVSVSGRNGQQKRSILIFPLGNKQEGALRYLLLKYQLWSQEIFSKNGYLGHSTSQQVISWMKDVVLSVPQREKTFKHFDCHFHISLAFPSGKLSEEKWKIGERSCTFLCYKINLVFVMLYCMLTWLKTGVSKSRLIIPFPHSRLSLQIWECPGLNVTNSVFI